MALASAGHVDCVGGARRDLSAVPRETLTRVSSINPFANYLPLCKKKYSGFRSNSRGASRAAL